MIKRTAWERKKLKIKGRNIKVIVQKIGCSLLSISEPYLNFRLNEKIINFQALAWCWLLAITNGLDASPQHNKVKDQDWSGKSKNVIYLIFSFMYPSTTDDKIKPVEAVSFHQLKLVLIMLHAK